MRRTKGMTLLEIMFVCFLMGLMMICLYQTFLPGIKAWQRSDVKTQVQQSVLVAVQRMTGELRASDIESMVIIKSSAPARDAALNGEGDILSFLSPFGPDDQPLYDTLKGTILWKKHAFFYLDSQTHTLYLQEQLIAPPTDTPALYQLSSFSPNPGKDRVVARNISSLAFKAYPDEEKDNTTLKNPVTVKITAARENYSSTLETSVSALYQKD